MELSGVRAMFEELGELATEPSGVAFCEAVDAGVPALWCIPAGADPQRVILYLHGGGFAACSPATHRKLAGHLAQAAGVTALVIDYRLTPEHPFPAQRDDAITAYQWLTGPSASERNVSLAGDSAGGNLVVATALRIRDLGLKPPAALVLYSPWLDLENTASTLETNAGEDLLISRALVDGMALMYLGEKGSATDPGTNPMRSDPAGLPPIYISVSDTETLLDDSLRFTQKARAAGVDVELEISSGQQHAYPLAAGRSAAASTTVTASGQWLKTKHDRAAQRA